MAFTLGEATSACLTGALAGLPVAGATYGISSVGLCAANVLRAYLMDPNDPTLPGNTGGGGDVDLKRTLTTQPTAAGTMPWGLILGGLGAVLVVGLVVKARQR